MNDLFERLGGYLFANNGELDLVSAMRQVDLCYTKDFKRRSLYCIGKALNKAIMAVRFL